MYDTLIALTPSGRGLSLCFQEKREKKKKCFFWGDQWPLMCFSRACAPMDDACKKSEITCWRKLDGSPWNCLFLYNPVSWSRDAVYRPSRWSECSTAIDQPSRLFPLHKTPPDPKSPAHTPRYVNTRKSFSPSLSFSLRESSEVLVLLTRPLRFHIVNLQDVCTVRDSIRS